MGVMNMMLTVAVAWAGLTLAVFAVFLGVIRALQKRPVLEIAAPEEEMWVDPNGPFGWLAR